MPFRSLDESERTLLMPTLFLPAEILKKRLDPARSGPPSPISPRLQAPARQLQNSLLRVKVSKLFKERPPPKHTLLSPCLARVSRELAMQRKKDTVSRTLSKREPQEPPKLAFSLQGVARQLASRMVRDKVSQQLSPTLRKRTFEFRSDTSLASLNDSFGEESYSQSPKTIDFTSLVKLTPILEPTSVPIMASPTPSEEQVVDEAGWQVVTSKRRKQQQAKKTHKSKKERKNRKPYKAAHPQPEERKRSGVYPTTANSGNANVHIQPWFMTLTYAEKETHNRSCALRRIMRKEEKTRMEILRKMRSKTAAQEESA